MRSSMRAAICSRLVRVAPAAPQPRSEPGLVALCGGLLADADGIREVLPAAGRPKGEK